MARILSLHSTGGDVALIQKAFQLIQMGGPLADGKFGTHTQIRTQDYQFTRLGLAHDGRVGDQTRRKMAEDIRNGFVVPVLVAQVLRRGITLDQFAQAIIDGKSAVTNDPLDFRFF